MFHKFKKQKFLTKVTLIKGTKTTLLKRKMNNILKKHKSYFPFSRASLLQINFYNV